MKTRLQIVTGRGLEYTNKSMKGKQTFIADYLTYLSIERNQRKAKEAIKKNNIERVYGRDGTIMLLLHYCEVLIELCYEKAEAIYVVGNDYLKRVETLLYTYEMKMKGMNPEHYIPLLPKDNDVLMELVKVSSLIKSIMVDCYDIEIDERRMENDLKKIDKFIE